MTADAAELPETPEELTASWLSTALGWPIDVVDREILGQGQGFLGDIVRLRLTSSDAAAPKSVIAKIPKKANRATGEMLGVYEREILFFQELAEDVPARTPKVHYSYYDRDAGSEKQKEILAACDRVPGFLTPLVAIAGAKIAAAKKRKYLLIMEDLGELELGDQWVGATLDQCRLVLQNIASTHRRFWNSAALAEKFWLLPMDIDARMRHRMFKSTLPALREVAPAGLEPVLAWLKKNGAKLIQSLARETPQTLLHSDLRLDNVCFSSDGCAYLDWQLTRLGPAAYDVAYFIGGAMSPDISADAERELVREYHRSLDAPDYAFDIFWRDYQRALVLSLTSLAPNADVAIDAGRGQEMMNRWRERLAARLRGVDLAGLA